MENNETMKNYYRVIKSKGDENNDTELKYVKDINEKFDLNKLVKAEFGSKIGDEKYIGYIGWLRNGIKEFGRYYKRDGKITYILEGNFKDDDISSDISCKENICKITKKKGGKIEYVFYGNGEKDEDGYFEKTSGIKIYYNNDGKIVQTGEYGKDGEIIKEIDEGEDPLSNSWVKKWNKNTEEKETAYWKEYNKFFSRIKRKIFKGGKKRRKTKRKKRRKTRHKKRLKTKRKKQKNKNKKKQKK